MKFIYSDSLDYIDPDFDFESDRTARNRKIHSDDKYPHEYLPEAPYDGMLVSRAIVGDHIRSGKYSESQCMRFHRDGARAFLRYPEERYPGSILMGDCGAFSYRNELTPPYSVDDTLEFYEVAGFTHGFSIDHLIFDFQDNDLPPSDEARRRQEITLANAELFLKESRNLGPSFTPLGVIQGWSPASKGEAARALKAMGYKYLAVGGLVPLQMPQIEMSLAEIRDALDEGVGLHLLGFGKFEELPSLERYGVVSFDTTSPLLRAFKDGKKNYYLMKNDGTLDYYTAVRVPQATENVQLQRSARTGRLNQEILVRLERDALTAIRAFAERRASVEDAVDRVIAYGEYAAWEPSNEVDHSSKFKSLRATYLRSLGDRPWESCSCRVCDEAGVETMIFRSSNRNKRRGIHNLHVIHKSMKSFRESSL